MWKAAELRDRDKVIKRWERNKERKKEGKKRKCQQRNEMLKVPK